MPLLLAIAAVIGALVLAGLFVLKVMLPLAIAMLQILGVLAVVGLLLLVFRKRSNG
jgi:MFS superfamily sulfate permease-like transporter